MFEISLIVIGCALLGALLLGLKLLEWTVRLVIAVLVLPFQLLGALLSILGSILLLPFQLLGGLLAGVGLLLGVLVIPLLPLVAFGLIVAAIVAGFRAARRPARVHYGRTHCP